MICSFHFLSSPYLLFILLHALLFISHIVSSCIHGTRIPCYLCLPLPFCLFHHLPTFCPSTFLLLFALPFALLLAGSLCHACPLPIFLLPLVLLSHCHTTHLWFFGLLSSLGWTTWHPFHFPHACTIHLRLALCLPCHACMHFPSAFLACPAFPPPSPLACLCLLPPGSPCHACHYVLPACLPPAAFACFLPFDLPLDYPTVFLIPPQDWFAGIGWSGDWFGLRMKDRAGAGQQQHPAQRPSIHPVIWFQCSQQLSHGNRIRMDGQTDRADRDTHSSPPAGQDKDRQDTWAGHFI